VVTQQVRRKTSTTPWVLVQQVSYMVSKLSWLFIT
jgi:hypothetical protein